MIFTLTWLPSRNLQMIFTLTWLPSRNLKMIFTLTWLPSRNLKMIFTLTWLPSRNLQMIFTLTWLPSRNLQMIFTLTWLPSRNLKMIFTLTWLPSRNLQMIFTLTWLPSRNHKPSLHEHYDSSLPLILTELDVDQPCLLRGSETRSKPRDFYPVRSLSVPNSTTNTCTTNRALFLKHSQSVSAHVFHRSVNINSACFLNRPLSGHLCVGHDPLFCDRRVWS